MLGTVVVAEKEVEEGAEEEEEEDEAVKKKKSRKDDENNNSSSDENLVLLATATIAGGIVALNGGPEESLEKIQGFMLSFWNGLVGNHARRRRVHRRRVLGDVVFWHAYALWRSSAVPRPIGNPIQRKSRTLASTLHVFSGAGALAVALYAVVLERVFRESPGWTWMWVTPSLFLVNSLSYGPLMNIFKASKEGKYAMQLGYSFVASFQGVVWIAWSAQPDARIGCFGR